VFSISTKFFPIRLSAYKKDSVELSIEVENQLSDAAWVECDVSIPEVLSLAPNRELAMGRLRIGIVGAKQIGTGRCKIYSGAKTYPDMYQINIRVYGYGRNGDVLAKKDLPIQLRVEQVGKI